MKNRSSRLVALGCVALLGGCNAQENAEAIPTPPGVGSQKPPVESHATQQEAASPARTEVRPEVAEGMLLIAGGAFFMGVETPKTGIESGRMTTVHSFAIDRTEISVEAYLACQHAGKCDSELHRQRGCNATDKPPRTTHPMNCVTWHEAVRYCESLGKRLPTSIEWERAARGTDRRPYPWGTALPGEQLCWQGRKGQARSTTCPVGSFPEGASPYGVLDMSGNVAEWTSTVAEGAYPPPIYVVRGSDYVLDPAEDREWSFRRVDMGGSGSGNPNYPQANVGFRCVMDINHTQTLD